MNESNNTRRSFIETFGKLGAFFAGQEAVLLDPDQVIQGITHYGAPKRKHFQTR